MPRSLPLIILVLLFTVHSALAQKEKTAPPGTIHLKDSLYIDKVPVTIDSYNEFLRALQTFWNEKVHDTIESLPKFGLVVNETDHGMFITNKAGAILLDSTVLQPDAMLYQQMNPDDRLVVDLATNLTMDYYMKAMAYKNNPVIYVTHEQAAMFCKWRNDMVMLHYAVDADNKNQRKRYYSKVTYRLMSEDEWKYAFNTNALIHLSDFGIRGDFNKKSFANYMPLDSRHSEPVFNIYANNFAEMLLEKRNMIGVLWNDNTQDSKNIVTKSYAPASNVGFRCVCEVTQ